MTIARMRGRVRRRLGAAIGAALAVAAVGAGAEPSFDPMLAEMGAPYFERHCASCHGVGARGDGPVAVELRTSPADLTRIAARRSGVFPDAEIARVIDGRFEITAHGVREMPIWGSALAADVPESSVAEEVTRGKILMLVEYLKSIQRAAPEP